MYITDSDALEAFCREAATHRAVAVDTEFIRERSYHPRLCLVQLATDEAAAAIDPFAVEDLGPLASLLANASLTKVFHACTQDLEVLHHALGVVPAPVFDTQLAAAFLGHRMQLGYGALVDAFCGVHLPKAGTLTDWARRPLDASQLRYAEDDVIYLPRIYEQMMAELILRGRLSWLAPEMAELTAPERFARSDREAYLHLRRSSSLTRRQLAIAREVCAWRERTAEHRDIPRRWVVTDEVVVEACRLAPTSAARVRRIRGTEQLSDSDADAMAAAVRRGTRCDPAAYPKARRHERPSAEVEGALDLMSAMLRLISERSGVAMQLIAGRDDLHDLLVGRSDARLSKGWRHELAGTTLERLVAGEVGLTVKGGRVEQL